MPVLAAFAALFIAVLIYRSAISAASVGWPLVALAAIALVAVALVFWHRRKMAELRDKYAVWVGRYRTIGVRPWPKACRDCGATVGDWKAAGAHDLSACAAFARVLESSEGRPVPWTAVVEEGLTGIEGEQ